MNNQLRRDKTRELFPEILKASQQEGITAELLGLLLTPEEHEQLVKRILIVNHLIRNEKSQREIAEELEVSISKITRGSNSLKAVSKKLRDFLQTFCGK